MQAKAIRSLGCAAEAVTVGHNPYCKASAMDHSIVLPTTRTRFYGSRNVLESEGVMEGLMETRYGSLERLVAMQVMFCHMAARVAAFWYVLPSPPLPFPRPCVMAEPNVELVQELQKFMVITACTRRW